MKKSIKAAIEEIAKLLRKETKSQIKPRKLSVLPPTNTIECIAKLIRTEIHKQEKEKEI